MSIRTRRRSSIFQYSSAHADYPSTRCPNDPRYPDPPSSGTLISPPLPCHHKDSVAASESPVIIPPKTRKRKAAEARLPSTIKESHPNKRTSASAGHNTLGSPPTPQTSASTTMDSDDEMLSNLSSDEDVLQDESDSDADDGTLTLWLVPPLTPSLDFTS